MQAFQHIGHSLNGGWVRRDEAVALIRPVPDEIQEILNAERRNRGLSLVDDEPITNDNTQRYEQMLTVGKYLFRGLLLVCCDLLMRI